MSQYTADHIKAIFSNPQIKIAYCAIQPLGRGKMLVTVRGYDAAAGEDNNVEAVVRYVPQDVRDLITNHKL